MVKEKSKILVRDVQTQQTLFECSVQEPEKAWQFAAEMEEMGLDIEVISPTISDTLSNSLGLTTEQQEAFKESMEEEMESHEGSCCFTNEEDKKIH